MKKVENDKLLDISHEVGKATYKYFNKKIEKEIAYAFQKKPLAAVDLVNVVVNSIGASTLNILLNLKDIIQNNAEKPISMDSLFNFYIHHMVKIMDEYNDLESRNKMN